MTRLIDMISGPRKTPRKAKRKAAAKPGGNTPRGRRTKAQPKATGGRWRLLRWALVAAIWSAVLLGGVLAWYAYDLPDLGRIAQLTRKPSVTLLAADGAQLAAIGEVYGETVALGDLPAHLPQAVLAVEDRRFYRHFGLDVLGLARAMWVNLRAGRIVQGGSTISQQLAKILFLTPERTVKRKVQEMLLALWLERKFSTGPDPRALPQPGLSGGRHLWGRRRGPGAISAGRPPRSTSTRRRCSPACSRRRRATIRRATPGGRSSAQRWCCPPWSRPAI